MNDLKSIRTSIGLTQYDLQDRSGIHQVHISMMETGLHQPNRRTCERIERALGRPVDWISTSKIKLRDSDLFQAEQLLKQLIEITLSMIEGEKRIFNRRVRKYFK
jgi:transcriptional regulator with XRE-family HTH domain